MSPINEIGIDLYDSYLSYLMFQVFNNIISIHYHTKPFKTLNDTKAISIKNLAYHLYCIQLQHLLTPQYF